MCFLEIVMCREVFIESFIRGIVYMFIFVFVCGELVRILLCVIDIKECFKKNFKNIKRGNKDFYGDFYNNFFL